MNDYFEISAVAALNINYSAKAFLLGSSNKGLGFDASLGFWKGVLTVHKLFDFTGTVLVYQVIGIGFEIGT